VRAVQQPEGGEVTEETEVALCSRCGGSLEEGDRGMGGEQVLTSRGWDDRCDACTLEEGEDDASGV